VLFTFAREAAGALGTRLSLRPLFFRGTMTCTTRARSAPRDRGLMWSNDEPRTDEDGPRGKGSIRSAHLTIFWHCGLPHFSSRTARDAVSRQRTFNGFGRGFALQTGSGNADSRRKLRSFGWSGQGRPRDPGCVPAHPASWRAAASYRPLRAVWAVCAWALRGSREITRPLQRS